MCGGLYAAWDCICSSGAFLLLRRAFGVDRGFSFCDSDLSLICGGIYACRVSAVGEDESNEIIDDIGVYSKYGLSDNSDALLCSV